MRVLSLSTVIARNVADAATSATTPAPVAAPAAPVVAKPTKPASKRVLAKPASKQPGKPATKPATAPVKLAKPEAAKPSGNVTRTASTIAAGACNFGNLSDRDTAYMRFYAGLAKRLGGVVTLRGIVDSGHSRVPGATFASAKPHDAGVIQRLNKAGLVTIRDNGAAFVFTKLAHTHAAYVAGFGKPA